MKITKRELQGLIREEHTQLRGKRRDAPKKPAALSLDEAKLRRIIEAELTQVGGNMAAAGGSTATLKKLKDHLNGAKQALSELYQSSTSSRASDQAQSLLQGLNRMIQALDSMPELTAGKSTPPAPMAKRRLGGPPSR